MRISDWSSDVCSSDLPRPAQPSAGIGQRHRCHCLPATARAGAGHQRSNSRMSRILVVEDEPSLRTDLVDYLAMRGFAAEGAGSARELRTALKDRKSTRLNSSH